MRTTPSHDNANQSSDELFGTLLEEIAQLLRSGRPVDIASYQRDYPEHADRIAQMLPTLEAMVDLGEPSTTQVASNTEPADDTGERILGDFRIIRELGRGGMGVVYEAEQISLGRTVALKVLPFAAVMDQKAITRFKNEARAAATLEHPHIVPVHAVGNERGVYFYAMSLVQGMTLSEVIHELRQRVTRGTSDSSSQLSIDEILSAHGAAETSDTNSKASCFDQTRHCQAPSDEATRAVTETDQPTQRELQAAVATQRSLFTSDFFRNAARLGCEAAEALDHAHEHGIVHRDIKPGNLMIDQGSKLWVTDFGLARIDTDGGMTVTGDLIGTLRYMSPEQALANRVVVDHRADIYALGVTLYELLTLRPTYDGADREQLLRQIAFEEPKSLRHHNRSVPVDLETIVLKAIAKNPDERYSSAQQLADDLRAFLANEPIQAKPPTIVQRASKWAQRHKPLVTSAAIILVFITIGLAISNRLIAQQRDAAEVAQQNEQRERVNAERQRNEAERQRENADRERVEAERHKKIAEENFQRAREAVDTYLTKVSQEHLLDAPSLQPLRNDLLQLALRYYQEFIEKRKDDPSLRAELAAAYDRAAELTQGIGSLGEALKLHQKALNIREALSASDPGSADDSYNLSDSMVDVADVYGMTGKTDKQKELLLKALRIRQELQKQHSDVPKYSRALASSWERLAGLYRKRERIDEALEFSHNAIEVREDDARRYPDDFASAYGLARSYCKSAYIQTAVNVREAIQLGKKGVVMLEELLGQRPHDLSLQHHLAVQYLNLGSRHNELGDYEKALNLQKEAIQMLEPLAEDNPSVNSYQVSLSTAYVLLANTHKVSSLTEDEALGLQQRAMKIRETLLSRNPDGVENQMRLATSYSNLATRFASRGEIEKSLEFQKKAMDVRKKLVQSHPEIPRYRHVLANSFDKTANLHAQTDEIHEAKGALLRAIAMREELVADYPKNRRYRNGLLVAYLQLRKLHAETTNEKGLAECWQKVTSVIQGKPADRRTVADWGYLGQALTYLGQWSEARDALERGIKARGEQHPTLKLGPRWWCLAESLRHLGEAEKARSIFEALVKEANESPDANHTAANLSKIGQALYRLERWSEAREMLEAAMEKRGDEGPTLLYGSRWWYLAMTLQQLGELEQAQEHYDQLVDLFEQIPSPSIAQQEIRAEAARVFGVPLAAASSQSEQELPVASFEQSRQPQRNDPDFKPTIAQPLFSIGSGPRVLVDESHGNFHTIDGRYQGLAKVLRADGYRVDKHDAKFSQESLSETDVLVVANALPVRIRELTATVREKRGRNADQSAFSDDEIKAVVAWVQDGGSLLLIADHKPYGAAAMKLAAEFGIQMTDGFVVQPGQASPMVFRRSDGQIAAHPITDGTSASQRIDEVATFTGQAFRTERDSGLSPLLVLGHGAVLLPDRRANLTGDEEPKDVAGWLQAAAGEVGRGRVAVFGEAAMFSAQLSARDGGPMGMNSPRAKDNQQLLRNVVRWLADNSPLSEMD